MTTLSIADQTRLSGLLDEVRLLFTRISIDGNDGPATPSSPPHTVHPEGAGRLLVGRLTAREEEIARALAAGMSNKSIASRLFISVNTVRFHVRNVLRKLEVGGREDVALVLADGLIDRDSVRTVPPSPAPVQRLT